MTDIKRNLDLVVDANIMRLYDKPKDPKVQELFLWIRKDGTLTISQKLLNEYIGSQRDSGLIQALIMELMDNRRLKKIKNKSLKEFSGDRRYNYTCNGEDHMHARLVFLSKRKKLLSFDEPLINDVNGFKKIDGVHPKATKDINKTFYA
ncbi:hypothetical protein ACNQ6O_02395 [Marinobacter sp. SBS5]|uniref:hypothetical protein n=1 Tax=Marinobacter sp. SBS5 TaxID=3401754 RepID=UPI003AABC70B